MEILIQPNNSCTLTTCPLSQAEILYDPNLGGNAFYLAIFALLLLSQLILGISQRTWGFLAGMSCGLLLEVIGYAGRIQLHFNPFRKDPFVMNLVCLTIGPVFLSGAMYLCLARIIVAYGERVSRFQPRTYTITLMCCDALALILQVAGGGITSYATTVAKHQRGVNIMVSGLALQVVSLVLFTLSCGDFALRVRNHQDILARPLVTLRQSSRFRIFLYGLGLAILCLLIRSCFRVAELSRGFGSKLANQEVTFMILEGAMVLIASIALTVLHPGIAFQGNWAAADFAMRHGRKKGGFDAKLGVLVTDVEK